MARLGNYDTKDVEKLLYTWILDLLFDVECVSLSLLPRTKS